MLTKIEKSLSDTDNWLRTGFALSAKQQITPRQIELLKTYFDLLTAWSKKVDLVALASPDQLIERHLVDCYAAYVLIKSTLADIKSCLDVGSGAGLPGIIFAILEPQGSFSLCEPREKRQFFLKEVVARLALGNVEILGQRLENISLDNRYDLICSRALGMENSFDGLARPLLQENGKICQMLGPSWDGMGREKPVTILNYTLYSGGPARKLVFWE